MIKTYFKECFVLLFPILNSIHLLAEVVPEYPHLLLDNIFYLRGVGGSIQIIKNVSIDIDRLVELLLSLSTLRIMKKK